MPITTSMEEHLLLFRKSIEKSTVKISDEVKKIEKFIPPNTSSDSMPKKVVSFVKNCFVLIWGLAKKKIPKDEGWEWAMRGASLLARVSSEDVAFHLVELISLTKKSKPSELLRALAYLFGNMNTKFPNEFVFNFSTPQLTPLTTNPPTNLQPMP